MDKIVAVIPALNEAKTIGYTVRKALAYVDEIFVVDDGSDDDTSQKARKSGATVIRHVRTLGKWSALRTGFSHAIEDPDVVALIQLDGDGQHEPKDIPRFLQELRKGSDLVIGQRKIVTAPLVRCLANRLSSLLLASVFKCRVEDSQCGFRAYSRQALVAIDPSSRRYEGETETLLRAQSLGIRIREVVLETVPSRADKRALGKRLLLDPLDFVTLLTKSLPGHPWNRRGKHR